MPIYDHPGLYVNVIPPQIPAINGVPFNVGGVVGSASFGPVNAPTPFGNYGAGAAIFGTPNARLFDMMTAVSAAALQGPNCSFVGVRVTDGTDVAASGSLGNNGTLAFWTAVANAINQGAGVARGPSVFIVATATSTGITIAAKYTGSFGNKIAVSLLNGSQGSSYRVGISAPGVQPEVFDNLGATQAAAVAASGTVTFTTNPANNTTLVLNGTTVTFVNSGASGSQVNIGSSLNATLANLLAFLQGSADAQLVKFLYSLAGAVLTLTAATPGTGGNSLTTVTTVSGATASGATLSGGAAAMTAPTVTASVTLSGGTDGAGSITKQIMVGSDVAPRTGLYALRNSGCAAAILTDLTDATSFSTQDAFGGSENIFLGITNAAGDTVAAGTAIKSANLIDTTNLKYLLGDWITYNDTVNGIQRKISPQGFWLGVRCNIGPHQSPLNKIVYGIVSTEKSAANQVYAAADLAAIYSAGMDVIALPSPGGQSYFACQTGRNASSNPNVRGENYSTMTNYIVRLLRKNAGVFIGRLQSLRSDDTTRRKAKAQLDAIMGMLADRNIRNPPMIDDFQTILDGTNNTSSTIPAGFMFAYVKVVYMSVVEFFGINMEGGQGVQITRTGVTTADQPSSASAAGANAPFLSGGGF